jgi:hypothetical protein
MPQITGALFEGKPIIQVAVSEGMPPLDTVTPQPNPASFHIREYRALLDTGADVTCVLPHVVKQSFLVPRGLISMTSGSGTHAHMSYLISVGVWCEEVVDLDGEMEVTRTLYQIPGGHIAAEIRANSWFDMIIGMDIISQHELRFTKGGGFCFKLG